MAMTVTPRWQQVTSLLALELSIDHLLGAKRTQAAPRQLDGEQLSKRKTTQGDPDGALKSRVAPRLGNRPAKLA